MADYDGIAFRLVWNGPTWVVAPASNEGTGQDFQEQVFSRELATGATVAAFRNGLIGIRDPSWAADLVEVGSDASGWPGAARHLASHIRMVNVQKLCLVAAIYAHEKPNLLDTAWVAPGDLLFFGEDALPQGPGYGLSAGFEPNRRTNILTEAIVDASCDKFDALLQHPSGEALLTLAYLYWQSWSSFSNHNYALSTVTAWTVAEAALARQWATMIESVAQDSERVPRARRDRLDNSQSFTSSVIMETLELMGELPHDLYKQLNVARSARNKWLHDLNEPNQITCVAALRAAHRLVLHTLGFQFGLQP